MRAQESDSRAFYEREGVVLTEILSGTREAFGGDLSELRPWPVLGDMMEPVVKRGDLLLCRPVTRYEGFGVYLLNHGSIHKVDRHCGPTLLLMSANNRYPTEKIKMDEFARSVTARVEYAITALGGRPVPGAIELGRQGWRQ